MIDGDVVLLDFLALHVEGRITVLDRERPPGLLLGGRRCDQADRQGQKHETGYQPPMTLHRRPPVLDLPSATLAGGWGAPIIPPLLWPFPGARTQTQVCGA